MASRFSSVRTCALTTTTALAVPASQDRVTLVFTPPASGSYQVGVDRGAGPSDPGNIVLTLTVAPLELTLERHGEIVRLAWYGKASTGMSVGVLETIELADNK